MKARIPNREIKAQIDAIKMSKADKRLAKDIIEKYSDLFHAVGKL